MQELSDWLAGLSRPALIALLVLVGLQLVLQIGAVWDLARRWRDFRGKAWIWLVIILAGNLLGAVLYLAVGRSMATTIPSASDVGAIDTTDTTGAAKRAVDKLYGPGKP